MWVYKSIFNTKNTDQPVRHKYKIQKKIMKYKYNIDKKKYVYKQKFHRNIIKIS